MISSSHFKIHIFLLFAVVLSGVHCSHYIGCFREALSTQRLLGNERKEFKGDLTPKKCIKHCESKGYHFAGVEYGDECYCSNNRPELSYLANHENECNSPCSGDKDYHCGGSWRVGVYASSDHGHDYVKKNYEGCYKKKHRDVLTSVKTNEFEDSLTPELCLGHCFRLGYKYAAVQNGNECSCGNTIEGSKDDKDKCKEKCSGYKSLKKCGGKSHSTVYSTGAHDLMDLHNSYLGCFIESSSTFKVSEVFPNTLTPQSCVQHCVGGGYKYAALQESKCFCGDENDEKLVADEQCDLACSGKKSLICGGRGRHSIYKTNVPGGHFVGCFEDNGQKRILPERLILPNNTPTHCVAACKARGKSFAGVEYGQECFCGNKRSPGRKVPDNECFSQKCPGDSSKKCGGNWRLGVYTTGS